MGWAIRLAAIALMATLAVALAAPLVCAHDDGVDPPRVVVTRSSDRIVEGGSASYGFTLEKLWDWIFDASYVTCAIDPSTTANLADFTITPVFSNSYSDENPHQ